MNADGSSEQGSEAQANPGMAPFQPERADTFPAWEMISEGRYQPRRIRGSLCGRELG